LVDRNVVASKLTALAERIARVRLRTPDDQAAFVVNLDALELVSFNLMLAVQCCIDIAAHVIADQDWIPTGTLGEAFGRLRDHGAITVATCDALKRAVGLRNVVAHAYGAVDPALVHRAATAGLADLDTFAREISTWLLTAA
jgi:uncharacterized protein YutE (UPF0331/DUF86 family)